MYLMLFPYKHELFDLLSFFCHFLSSHESILQMKILIAQLRGRLWLCLKWLNFGGWSWRVHSLCTLLDLTVIFTVFVFCSCPHYSGLFLVSSTRSAIYCIYLHHFFIFLLWGWMQKHWLYGLIFSSKYLMCVLDVVYSDMPISDVKKKKKWWMIWGWRRHWVDNQWYITDILAVEASRFFVGILYRFGPISPWFLLIDKWEMELRIQ